MKDIVIIGAGNFGREVAQLISDINRSKLQWNLLGYIDETPEKQKALINNIPVLGGPEWLYSNKRGRICSVFAIGNPRNKYRLIQKLKNCDLAYPNLIHPDAAYSGYLEIGFGNIICWGCFLSVNIRIGNYVSINPACGIGHDTVIKDYATLYWNVTLSGNVTINEGCELGSKTTVIPLRNVGRWSITGAGAVVTKDLPPLCTAVGVPAKPIKYHSDVTSEYPATGIATLSEARDEVRVADDSRARAEVCTDSQIQQDMEACITDDVRTRVETCTDIQVQSDM